MTFVIKQLFYVVLLVNFSLVTHFLEAKPKMEISNWPVFECAAGMAKSGYIPNFEFSTERYTTTIKRLENEAIDLTFLTLDDFVTLSRRQPGKFVAIAVLDYSNGGDAMIVKPNIMTAEQLKGKIIGLHVESVSLWLLHLILDKAHLSLKDIQIKNIAAEFIDKAFANPTIEAVVGWEPNISQTMDNSKGKILFSSADFPEQIFDLIVVNKESITSYRDDYKDLLQKWFPATKNESIIAELAKYNEISVEEYKIWLNSGAHIYHTAELSYEAFPKLKKNAGEIMAFYNISKNEIPENLKRLFGPKNLNVDELFDFSMLSEIIKKKE